MKDLNVDQNIGEENEILKPILRSIFQLTNKQTELFQQLYEFGKDSMCCMNNLMLKFSSDRSVIQKYLNILLGKGLISRVSKTLNEYQQMCADKDIELGTESPPNKGYLYVYTPVSKEEILSRADYIYNAWKNVLIEKL